MKKVSLTIVLCFIFSCSASQNNLSDSLNNKNVKDQSNEIFRSFQLSSKGNLTMKLSTGITQDINSETVLKYSIERKGHNATLELDSLQANISQNGKEVINNRVGKGMFKNGFGEPVCRLIFDEKGNELKRTSVENPQTQPLINEGVIANALFFHSMFSDDHNKWESSNEYSMGNGRYVRGILTYEKEHGIRETGNEIRVNVSGLLTNTDVKNQAVILKNIRYEVSGTQIFDTSVKEWKSGNILFRVSYDMESGNKNVGNSYGNINLKMDMLPPLVNPTDYTEIRSDVIDPQKVNGWYTAEWGMTESQLAEALKNKAEPCSPGKYQGSYVKLCIKNFLIDNFKYDVFFQMGDKTKLLEKILIKPSESNKNDKTVLFTSLEKMLVKTYGVPNTKTDGGRKKFIRKWNLPKTIISLEFASFFDEKVSWLILTYTDGKLPSDRVK